jgi:hypothetical protein
LNSLLHRSIVPFLARFGAFYIAFFLFATYCNIPYDALGPELTGNNAGRWLCCMLARLL